MVSKRDNTPETTDNRIEVKPGIGSSHHDKTSHIHPEHPLHYKNPLQKPSVSQSRLKWRYKDFELWNEPRTQKPRSHSSRHNKYQKSSMGQTTSSNFRIKKKQPSSYTSSHAHVKSQTLGKPIEIKRAPNTSNQKAQNVQNVKLQTKEAISHTYKEPLRTPSKSAEQIEQIEEISKPPRSKSKTPKLEPLNVESPNQTQGLGNISMLNNSGGPDNPSLDAQMSEQMQMPPSPLAKKYKQPPHLDNTIDITINKDGGLGNESALVNLGQTVQGVDPADNNNITLINNSLNEQLNAHIMDQHNSQNDESLAKQFARQDYDESREISLQIKSHCSYRLKVTALKVRGDSSKFVVVEMSEYKGENKRRWKAVEGKEVVFVAKGIDLKIWFVDSRNQTISKQCKLVL